MLREKNHGEVGVLEQDGDSYDTWLNGRTRTHADVLPLAFVCHQTSRALELRSSVTTTKQGKYGREG